MPFPHISFRSHLPLLLALLLVSLFIGMPPQLHAQCREDQAWNSAWKSCETALSPNPERPRGHWLLYDFGEVYALGTLHIWNENRPSETQSGVQAGTIDYSLDGITWKEWGSFQLGEGTGLPYYSGEDVADLQALQARYILLSITQTWGDDDCTSLHELSFKVEDRPILPEGNTLWAYPNPTDDLLNLNFEQQTDGTVAVEVMDMLGKQVLLQRFQVTGGRVSLPLSLGSLAPGAYFVRVTQPDSQLIGATKILVR